MVRMRIELTRSIARRFPIALLIPAAFALASPAAARYTLQGLGVFGGMASEPAAINDQGQIAGTRTGT